MTRILVVEDEPGIALGLEDDLTLEGYEVVVVRDGESGVACAKQGGFDVILLDLHASQERRLRGVSRTEEGRSRDSDHHAHGQDP